MWIDSDNFGRILAMHSQMILSQVSAMLAEREPPVAREGVVVGGSFDPSDGTVEVAIGDTAAVLGDDNILPDTGISVRRLPLLTTHLGDQYGPVGNERALLIPSQSGYHVMLHHDEDDSQAGLPAGERWMSHRNASGGINASIKLTNDGATAGDGAGGLQILAGSLLKAATAGGISITADDALKTLTLLAGTIKLILDGQNGVLDLGAGSLTIANDAIITASKLRTILTTWAATLQPGSGVPPPTVTGSDIVESAE